MSDLLASDSPTNAAEFSVSEISGALKRVVEDAFGHVRVRGEISGFRGRHSSGHCYFALKDERARLEAVIWKGTWARLRFPPEEGMEVIATGRLTTYPGSSKYQIVVDNLEPAGAGALMALLEERKRKLAAEGLFDEARKRALPFIPRVIGVVTSPTGAVIRDIIHRIADRFPVRVVVWPVRVQGDTTGREVAAAVAGFNAFAADGPVPRPDLVIVARGGGSLEDLWGFNDEAVVRAVAASAIPVVSAVGHETDWTLLDLAADRRAPTPTGAAEMAVPVKAELEAQIAGLGARLGGCMSRHLERQRQTVRQAGRALPSPDQLLALPRRRFDEAGSRLGRALIVSVAARRRHLGGLRLSPHTLRRRLDEAQRRLDRAAARLPAVFTGRVGQARMRFARDAARVSPAGLLQRLQQQKDNLSVLDRRRDAAITRETERRAARLAQAARLAESLSHKSVLARGFALVKRDGALVRRAGDVARGDLLSIVFGDGDVTAVAGSDTASARRPATPSRRRDGGRQGSLF